MSGQRSWTMQQAAAKPPQAATATWKLKSKIKQQHFVANYGKLQVGAGRGGKEVPASGAITCMQQLLLQGVISQ